MHHQCDFVCTSACCSKIFKAVHWGAHFWKHRQLPSNGLPVMIVMQYARSSHVKSTATPSGALLCFVWQFTWHILTQHVAGWGRAWQVATVPATVHGGWIHSLGVPVAYVLWRNWKYWKIGRSRWFMPNHETSEWAWTIKSGWIRVLACKTQPLWGSARSHSASRTHKLHLCFPPGLNWNW